MQPIQVINSAIHQLSSIEQQTNNSVEKIIDEYLDAVSRVAHTVDPVQHVSQIAKLVPLEKLQAAMNVDALQKAKDMFHHAKYYLKTTSKAEKSFGLHRVLSSLVDSLHTCTDSLIAAFGIQSFFKQARHEFENDMKSGKISNLIGMATLLTTALLPVLGAAYAGPIIGGALILIAALSIIYPRIRPLPHHINDADNWTKKAEEKTLQRGLTNKSVISHIATTVATKKRIILTGPSRVGKTQTAKDLTYALTEKSKSTKSLASIRAVFGFNTANLITAKMGDGIPALSKVSDALGRHSKKVIVVLDEFGKTCIDEKNNGLVIQLLTELEERFAYVIALATDEEYRVLCEKHPSLKNRFTQCLINSSSSNDTEKVLHHTLLDKAPQTLVDDGAFDYLTKQYEHRYKEAFPDKTLPPQPHSSKELLLTCIQRTSSTQQLPEDRSIEEKRSQLDFLASKAAVEQENEQTLHQIGKIRDEIAECKKTHKIRKEKFRQLLLMQEQLVSVKKEMYQAAIKIQKLAPSHLSQNEKIRANSFLLLRKLASKLEQQIRKQQATQQVKVVINRDLIDAVINEDIESMRTKK